MTDRFNVVSIGIENKSAIVVRVVMRPQTGWAVVSSSVGEGNSVEAVNKALTLGGKRHMHANDGHPLQPDPEKCFLAKSVPSEVFTLRIQPDDAERLKNWVVERFGRFKFTDTQGDVIEHLLPHQKENIATLIEASHR